MRARQAILLGAALAVGCASQRPATELFLELDAEPALRAETSSVRILVEGSTLGGAAETALDRTIAASDLVWPVTVGIVPRGDDARRGVRVEATLVTGTGGTARVSARSGFVPAQTRHLVLVFESCCVGMTCSGTETCAACACASDAVDASTLPVGTGDAGP